LYYHNAQTGESTYVRPLPSFRDFPPPQAQQKKKEKPLVKTPIPGTDWIRVKTTEGNVFYTHVSKRDSVWTAPKEIMEALSALEAQERLDETGSNRVTELEIERVKAEVQEMVKRKAEDAVPGAEMAGQKRAKFASDAGEESDDGDTDEEDWQREAAVQLAKEEEEHRKRLDEEENRAKEKAMKEKEEKEVLNTKAKELNMPSRVDLSLDEAKALFMVLSFVFVMTAHLPTINLRPCFERKISTLSIHGTHPFRYSSLILDTCFFHRYPSDVKFSTNTVVTARANYGNQLSRRRKKLQTRKRPLTAC
jgi:hypothetical protein